MPKSPNPSPDPRAVAASMPADNIVAGALEKSARLPPAFVRHFRASVRSQKRLWAVLLDRLTGRGFFPTQVITAEDLKEGMTFILPGIEASGPYPEFIRDALSAAGMAGAKEIFYWGMPMPEGYLPNLMWLKRNKSKAAELCSRIMAYQDSYPGRPVHIVANSGGAGPAIFAIEMLPPERCVESLVLLGGAVSDQYDLRPVLRRTRRGVLNCHSQRDGGILGLGTLIFGTADRSHSWSCGFKGFRLPEHLADDEAAIADYSKLFQLAWHRGLIDECDHFGFHDFSTAPEFVRKYVAAWMMGRPESAVGGADRARFQSESAAV